MSDTLTLIGTASIQEYLFRSNRLRDNVAASELLDQVFDDWRNTHGEKVVLHRGGQSVTWFPNQEDARRAVAAWSDKWLKAGFDARFVAVHHPVGLSWGQAYDQAKAE